MVPQGLNKYSNDELQVLICIQMNIYRVNNVTGVKLFVHYIIKRAEEEGTARWKFEPATKTPLKFLSACGRQT